MPGPTSDGSLASNILIAWTTLHVTLLLTFAIGILRNHANFQASLRLPLLQCLHVIMNAFISICVAARQVMSVHGLGAFPCILMDVASMLACTSYLFTHWVTGIHFLVLFDPARRKRFIRFVMPDVLIPIYVAVFLLGIAFGIISSLSRYNFCLHGCKEASGCWFQSNWLLTLPCRGVMDVVLALIGRELKCLKQGKDVTVMRDELERNALSAAILVPTLYTAVILHDVGVVTEGWGDWLVTCAALAYNSLSFYFGSFAPALRYGYSGLCCLNDGHGRNAAGTGQMYPGPSSPRSAGGHLYTAAHRPGSMGNRTVRSSVDSPRRAGSPLAEPLLSSQPHRRSQVLPDVEAPPSPSPVTPRGTTSSSSPRATTVSEEEEAPLRRISLDAPGLSGDGAMSSSSSPRRPSSQGLVTGVLAGFRRMSASLRSEPDAASKSGQPEASPPAVGQLGRSSSSLILPLVGREGAQGSHQQRGEAASSSSSSSSSTHSRSSRRASAGPLGVFQPASSSPTARRKGSAPGVLEQQQQEACKKSAVPVLSVPQPEQQSSAGGPPGRRRSSIFQPLLAVASSLGRRSLDHEEAAERARRHQHQASMEILLFLKKAPSQRVVSWVQQGSIDEISSEDILSLSQVRERYVEYCRGCHVSEKAAFVVNVLAFVNEEDEGEAAQVCEEMVSTFVRRSAKDQVGLGVAVESYTVNMATEYVTYVRDKKAAAAERTARSTAQLELERVRRQAVFSAAFEEIKDYLDHNILPNFKQTDDFQALMALIIAALSRVTGPSPRRPSEA